MKKHRLLPLNLIFLLGVTFTQNLFSEAFTEPLYIELGRSFGFTMGQQLTLNKIKSEYPTLSLQIKNAELEFNNTFGVAEKNIKRKLKGILKDKYPDFIAAMREQNNTLNSQRTTQELAQKFIEEVNLRATGKIPSPVLKTLLTYQFNENPVNEFSRGFKNVYRTKAHPKANGLDFQIEYPKSWSKQEGKRPNIIQLFSSKNGRGPAMAMIVALDILKESQSELTPQEIKSLMTLEGSEELASTAFSESSLIEMANGMGMTNVLIINTRRIVIDRWPGAVIEFTSDQQRLDVSMSMYSKMYIAIYKNYMIFLHCQIGELPNLTDNELKNEISKFEPLFRLMANSLVIQSQY